LISGTGIVNVSKSKQISARLHQLIPGGCHTYAKGDDQFPESAPGVIVRGQGCHVWDADDNEYLEYGMGLRSVGLGHAFPPVVAAAREALTLGTNFSRPSTFEAQCAEALLGSLVYGDMVKFAKDGSTVTTAAYKLSRALTGRPRIAICADHPFFAIHDWFIGTTDINAGTLREVAELTVKFRYNDPESLAHLFRTYPDQIACVMLEPVKYDEPEDNFLHKVRELAHANGALFILDEMITGFRWHNAGAQAVYEVEPDLACFGKAMANGFSVSALVGKRKYMEVGGLYHDRERVFLLSTTHGAETHALAAAMATIDFYRHEPVIETLASQGTKLADGIRRMIARHQLEPYVSLIGPPCNLVFTTKDATGQPSQEFRTLLLQELVARGILAPSLVISYSHGNDEINQTIRAFDGALAIYRDAIQYGLHGRLQGRPTQIVFRNYNAPPYQCAKQCSPDNDLPRDAINYARQH
jgi:glutamate-1-semialdehyde 2,1-aminomutase